MLAISLAGLSRTLVNNSKSQKPNEDLLFAAERFETFDTNIRNCNNIRLRFAIQFVCPCISKDEHLAVL